MAYSKSASNLSITVVVITRNRAAILGDCLTYLVGQDFPKDCYEVVVVDDGSTDDTPAVVSSWQEKINLPALHYVKQMHRGVNAARNNGIGHASGKVISLIDDDELTPPDYLTRVDCFLRDNLSLDGVGGPYKDYGGSKLHTCAQCSLTVVDVPGEGKRLVPRLLGGNMAVRKTVFEKVGLFDEAISGRGDEVEWFHRAAAFRFFYDPDLWIWHRRDNFNFTTLCRHAFVQGLSVPVSMKKQGLNYRLKPIRIIRLLAHAIRRRCVKGVVLALRELGAISSFLNLFRSSAVK